MSQDIRTQDKITRLDVQPHRGSEALLDGRCPRTSDAEAGTFDAVSNDVPGPPALLFPKVRTPPRHLALPLGCLLWAPSHSSP
jgi:hypothetical protein